MVYGCLLIKSPCTGKEGPNKVLTKGFVALSGASFWVGDTMGS